MKSGYELFVRPLLFSLDAETAHHFTVGLLGRASRFDATLQLLRFFRPTPKPVSLFGLTFPNPIGLAAGLDKNGVALPAWAALGFGFIEIGTVTAKAQPGNPRPRIFRLPEQQALINRLGFNNDGADAIAHRLAALRKSGRWPAVPVGNQYWQVESNAARTSNRRLPLLVSSPAGFCRLHDIECQLAKHTRFARVAGA